MKETVSTWLDESTLRALDKRVAQTQEAVGDVARVTRSTIVRHLLRAALNVKGEQVEQSNHRR